MKCSSSLYLGKYVNISPLCCLFHSYTYILGTLNAFQAGRHFQDSVIEKEVIVNDDLLHSANNSLPQVLSTH